MKLTAEEFPREFPMNAIEMTVDSTTTVEWLGKAYSFRKIAPGKFKDVTIKDENLAHEIDMFEETTNRLKQRPEAVNAVLAETDRQDKKWGADRDLPLGVWNLILIEEVGEFAQAILKYDGSIKHIRGEIVQVGAVALQIIEALDRGQARPKLDAPQ